MQTSRNSVTLVDAATYSTVQRTRFAHLPRIGETVTITEGGKAETYKVEDVVHRGDRAPFAKDDDLDTATEIVVRRV